MTSLHHVGAHVNITDTDGRTGVIVGYGTAVTYRTFEVDGKSTDTFAIVKLTAGFFSGARDVFVQLLLVHPDNLEVVPK